MKNLVLFASMAAIVMLQFFGLKAQNQNLPYGFKKVDTTFIFSKNLNVTFNSYLIERSDSILKRDSECCVVSMSFSYSTLPDKRGIDTVLFERAIKFDNNHEIWFFINRQADYYFNGDELKNKLKDGKVKFDYKLLDENMFHILICLHSKILFSLSVEEGEKEQLISEFKKLRNLWNFWF